jgi:hypothetical protein
MGANERMATSYRHVALGVALVAIGIGATLVAIDRWMEERGRAVEISATTTEVD